MHTISSVCEVMPKVRAYKLVRHLVRWYTTISVRCIHQRAPLKCSVPLTCVADPYKLSVACQPIYWHDFCVIFSHVPQTSLAPSLLYLSEAFWAYNDPRRSMNDTILQDTDTVMSSNDIKAWFILLPSICDLLVDSFILYALFIM